MCDVKNSLCGEIMQRNFVRNLLTQTMDQIDFDMLVSLDDSHKYIPRKFTELRINKLISFLIHSRLVNAKDITYFFHSLGSYELKVIEIYNIKYENIDTIIGSFAAPDIKRYLTLKLKNSYRSMPKVLFNSPNYSTLKLTIIETDE